MARKKGGTNNSFLYDIVSLVAFILKMMNIVHPGPFFFPKPFLTCSFQNEDVNGFEIIGCIKEPELLQNSRKSPSVDIKKPLPTLYRITTISIF